MTVKKQAMGPYQTNCYIATINNNDIVIDPGVDALNWIKENTNNVVAILNTHGHFDHVWSNTEVKEYFDAPIYCPKDDIFMLKKDPLSQGTPPSDADFMIEPDTSITIRDTEITFHFFPGHTPGCSAISIGDSLFTGDFIFENSIGRVDFPFSNPSDMKNSLKKILAWENDFTIYPGHGNNTTLSREKHSIKAWINSL